VPWQLTAGLYTIFTSLRSVQNRRVGKYKRDLSLYALFASFVCVFLVGLSYAIGNWSKVDHLAAIDAWVFLTVGGGLFASLNFMVIKLYRYIPASVAVYISLFNVISILFFTSIFTQEILTKRQWIGVAALFLAVLVIGLFSQNSKKTKNKKKLFVGFLIALLASLIFAPAVVNEKYLINRIGIETYLLYGWGMQATAATLVVFMFRNSRNHLKKMTRAMHLDVWTYGVLLGIAGFFFVFTLKNSQSASLTVISSIAKIGLTVVLAYIILKERDHLLAKVSGFLLSGIGLYLLFT